MKSGPGNSLFLLILSAIYPVIYFAGGMHLCYFKATFGIPCPGCGLTRAFVRLFSGNLAGAFYFHPLFLVVIVLAILMVFRKFPLSRSILDSSMFWVVILFLFVITYVIRMMFFFPDTEPMTLNRSAILFKIIGFIKNLI